ncbi:entericidin A/B family lipoprotein [Glycocaulis sp.]|uniref:entericidin A/B family lipoprotein n=1 Tax=Glycocaulis sp. TaxID=1969725 RepID=UPI0025C64173|nr:entericidin A/B family lipoprotein [Glycocaulis sp.]MCH8522653.1 entericidin A/B family lipoprotein [Glycocaulis sp.]
MTHKRSAMVRLQVEIKTMKATYIASGLAAILLILTACNTVQGAGRDIQGAGETIEDAAE